MKHLSALFRPALSGVLLPALVASVLVLQGCAHGGPYRMKSSAHPNPVGRTVEHFPAEGYHLGFVEFDEQGWLWGQTREQILQVQFQAEQAAGYTRDTQAAKHGIILVAFVHGWKHNASDDRGNNVESFQRALVRLAKDEKELVAAEAAKSGKPPRAPRPVFGVYLGWPGLNAKLEPFKEFSFYSRKAVADRVGYLGGVTEVLARLEKLHETINATKPVDAARSFFVVAGHSFGAQVVYDAVAQSMTERVVSSLVSVDLKFHRTTYSNADQSSFRKIEQELPADSPPVKPFGDMVVLLNPAFEADRYHNLWTLTQSLPFPPKQRPVFAVFSSDTDYATGFWFPLGRTFGTAHEGYRDDEFHREQYEANIYTIPWTASLVTHELLTEEEFGGTAPKAAALLARTAPRTGEGTDTGASMLEAVVGWNAAHRMDDLHLGNCVLRMKPGVKWTPFYVVRVRAGLIDGHSDIWNERFGNFLSKFIAISSSPQ